MQTLGCLTTFFFAVIIAVLVAVLNIFRALFAIKNRFKRNDSSQRSSSEERRGQAQENNAGTKRSNGHRQKIFEDGEGEYVDFEELPK